ncbi:acyl-CoA dehydrogenase [Xylophilus sp. Kf1]|nr:acyl-CoA dehydrogenase [Xylophilus sp. Kf1]
MTQSLPYTAPVREMLFAIEHLAGLPDLARLPGWEDAGPDTARAVLEEAARFSQGVIAPLNRIGDTRPSVLVDGQVRTPPGFVDAWRRFAEAGWQGLQHPVEVGGQDLPRSIGAACAEMFHSACLSFALCPMLTDGAIEALLAAGSPALRSTWLAPLVEGRWTGTMNLTEPQAGSDLSQVRTRAEPQPDGSHRITGTKIYITYGDHDMAANIVHLVLARTTGAPEGVKGISLFLVPKFHLAADGRPAGRNAVECVGLEHKLGIRASPTAVLRFEGATGHLVGREHGGLETMFVMMNAARYAVGLQGVAVAERACQQALAFARERVQGRPVDAPGDAPGPWPIAAHPDVRRMLLTMRALTEGCRALAAFAAGACDRSRRGDDTALRSGQQALYELLVPLVKGYATESGIEVASLGVQVHGGMGFIEETGAAQHYRDARILTIYEGTTAIQANDLVGRKTLRDGGAAMRAVLAGIEATEAVLARHPHPAAAAMRRGLVPAREALAEVVGYVLAHGRQRPGDVYAGSVPYLMLAGTVVAGWQLARGLLAALQALPAGGDADFLQARVDIALFHAAHLLPRAQAWRIAILHGAESTRSLPLN